MQAIFILSVGAFIAIMGTWMFALIMSWREPSPVMIVMCASTVTLLWSLICFKNRAINWRDILIFVLWVLVTWGVVTGFAFFIERDRIGFVGNIFLSVVGVSFLSLIISAIIVTVGKYGCMRKLAIIYRMVVVVPVGAITVFGERLASVGYGHELVIKSVASVAFVFVIYRIIDLFWQGGVALKKKLFLFIIGAASWYEVHWRHGEKILEEIMINVFLDNNGGGLIQNVVLWGIMHYLPAVTVIIAGGTCLWQRMRQCDRLGFTEDFLQSCPGNRQM